MYIAYARVRMDVCVLLVFYKLENNVKYEYKQNNRYKYNSRAKICFRLNNINFEWFLFKLCSKRGIDNGRRKFV